MTNHNLRGEIRPSLMTGDPYAEPYVVPLFALRRREWRVITPGECRVTDCPICAWRTAGLLATPRGTSHVVREPSSGYTCHSSYCPGCNALLCACLAPEYEDALAEAAYTLGHEHGTADGPDNRPTTGWLADACLDAESYLAGYDDACAGLPLWMPAEPLPAWPTAPHLWADIDDGLPF